MNEEGAVKSGGCCTYKGCIPIADLAIMGALASQERRTQGADFVHEFLRIGAAQDRGIMTQQQAGAYRYIVESGSGRTRSETNNPGNTAAPGGGA